MKLQIENTQYKDFYAVSNEERFVNKPSRVIQTDESGKVVSLTLRYYDNMPEGLVGVKGLITNQEFLALDDETIQNIYSEDIPDFESRATTAKTVKRAGGFRNLVSDRGY